MGQLGHGDAKHRPTPAALETPISSSRVVAVSAGFQRSMVLTEKGEVYHWGNKTRAFSRLFLLLLLL